VSGRRDALLVATSRYEDQRFQRLMAPLNDVKVLGSVLADSNLGAFVVSTISNKRRPRLYGDDRGLLR
jgi:hypothetical protein